METINKMIREGLNRNAKELKSEIIILNSYKNILEQDKTFDFDIKIGYSKDDDLLELYYTITNGNHEITIQFLMNELTFNSNRCKITTTLLKYADSYFNSKEFKVNIGSFDGDHYVGIEDYIKSFYDEGDIINLFIYDETLDVNIF